MGSRFRRSVSYTAALNIPMLPPPPPPPPHDNYTDDVYITYIIYIGVHVRLRIAVTVAQSYTWTWRRIVALPITYDIIILYSLISRIIKTVNDPYLCPTGQTIYTHVNVPQPVIGCTVTAVQLCAIHERGYPVLNTIVPARTPEANSQVILNLSKYARVYPAIRIYIYKQMSIC